MELDGKKFEEFRYDLSQDNDVVKDLRKKLHISGIYLANGSDLNTYKKYLQQISVPEQYIQNGFDINLDNSISGCMGRLFTEMVDRSFVVFTETPEEYAWTQLL